MIALEHVTKTYPKAQRPSLNDVSVHGFPKFMLKNVAPYQARFPNWLFKAMGSPPKGAAPFVIGEATGAPPKSLIRMFGPRGNPQAKNLFSVIGYLQKRAGVRLHVAG